MLGRAQFLSSGLPTPVRRIARYAGRHAVARMDWVYRDVLHPPWHHKHDVRRTGPARP